MLSGASIYFGIIFMPQLRMTSFKGKKRVPVSRQFFSECKFEYLFLRGPKLLYLALSLEVSVAKGVLYHDPICCRKTLRE